MPSGDPQRTWFPEMIEILRARWSDTMPFEELIELTAELDANLQAIRTARDIQPPMMWCPNCRRRHRSADPRVSVRATILAWGRFGVVSPEAVKALEKRWSKHRKEHHLDLYGRPPKVTQQDVRSCDG